MSPPCKARARLKTTIHLHRPDPLHNSLHPPTFAPIRTVAPLLPLPPPPHRQQLLPTKALGLSKLGRGRPCSSLALSTSSLLSTFTRQVIGILSHSSSSSHPILPSPCLSNFLHSLHNPHPHLISYVRYSDDAVVDLMQSMRSPTPSAQKFFVTQPSLPSSTSSLSHGGAISTILTPTSSHR